MRTIKVRELKTEFYHRFGVKYSVRISQVAARRLVTRIPVMGDEVRIRKARFPDAPDFNYTLFLENCSGDIFLTSANAPVERWAEYFKIEVIRRPEHA